jgi:hypothetical protein
LASYNDKPLVVVITITSYTQRNMNGISIGGPAAESKLPHHRTVIAKIHDFPGGLSAIQTTTEVAHEKSPKTPTPFLSR